MFAYLKALFHDSESRGYRFFSIFVWIMILLSLLVSIVEFSLGSDHSLKGVLLVFDRIVLWFFTVELLFRVVTYEPPALSFFKQSGWRHSATQLSGRLIYCLTPLMIIDFLTVVSLFPALRGLRALRILRLFRTTRVFSYSRPFRGWVRALNDHYLLFAISFSILGSWTLMGGVSIYLIEGDFNSKINSISDGLWWAIVTLTTVGYGDMSPVTTLGRIVGGILMVAGMFILALFAGVVGRTLLQTFLSVSQEQFRMTHRLGHIVVCGYEPGARMLLDSIEEEFGNQEQDVVIFADGERHTGISPFFSWLSGDPTKESELAKVRLPYASAVVLVGSRKVQPQHADATTILTAFTIRSYMGKQLLVKKRKKPLYLVAEILDAENVGHAMAAGVDEVIETTRLGFSLLAHAITMPGTAEVVSRVAGFGANSLYVGRVPETLEMPMSFGALANRIKADFGALLMGVCGPNGVYQINPEEDVVITGEQQLVYLSTRQILPL